MNLHQGALMEKPILTVHLTPLRKGAVLQCSGLPDMQAHYNFPITVYNSKWRGREVYPKMEVGL